ncbi:hypothetical protein BS78_09G064800 [Paspalum vaginatum]|nr:hypothetical protein BS78_09G064800 [Paspalum vaginatum]
MCATILGSPHAPHPQEARPRCRPSAPPTRTRSPPRASFRSRIRGFVPHPRPPPPPPPSPATPVVLVVGPRIAAIAYVVPPSPLAKPNRFRGTLSSRASVAVSAAARHHHPRLYAVRRSPRTRRCRSWPNTAVGRSPRTRRRHLRPGAAARFCAVVVRPVIFSASVRHRRPHSAAAGCCPHARLLRGAVAPDPPPLRCAAPLWYVPPDGIMSSCRQHTTAEEASSMKTAPARFRSIPEESYI